MGGEYLFCERKQNFCEFCDTCGFRGVDLAIIEKARRANKSKYGKRDQSRTIMCKLLSYKNKIKVLQNCKKLKGTHICINDDFCQATQQYRKELRKEVKRFRKVEDKIADLQYRSIVVKDKNSVR